LRKCRVRPLRCGQLRVPARSRRGLDVLCRGRRAGGGRRDTLHAHGCVDGAGVQHGHCVPHPHQAELLGWRQGDVHRHGGEASVQPYRRNQYGDTHRTVYPYVDSTSKLV